MSGLALGLGLAVLASVGLNGSYLLQHTGAANAPEVTLRRPVASFVGLFRSPVWLAGAAVGTAGWAMHITALTLAPLSLVQAFLAGGLVLVVPIAARLLHRGVNRAEVAAVALMTLALVGLTIGIDRLGDDHHFTTGPLSGFLGASAALSALLVLAVRGERRAEALGLAGGVLYGAADVAIKGLTGIGEDHGLGKVLVSPWLAVTVVASLLAFFCFQRGMQTGRALPVIALMTAGTNVVSILGGFAVFGDPLGKNLPLSLLHGVCFVLVGYAAWRLAGVQAALAAPDQVDQGGHGDPAAAASAAASSEPGEPVRAASA